MNKLLAMIFISLILASSAYGQQRRITSDGYHWRTLTQAQKQGYVMGMMHASSLIRQLTVEIQEEPNFSVSNRLYFGALKGRLEGWNFDNLGTFGQMIDGLDRQFKDYRMLSKDIGELLPLVRLELSGASAEQVEREKRILLMTADEYKKFMQESPADSPSVK